MEYKTLLVDSSYLAYQMYFSSMAAALDPSGTQLVYGFLVALIEINNAHTVDNLVIVWDNGHRAKDKLYAPYKKHHSSVLDEDQREDFNGQFCLLNSLLKQLGVKCCFAMDVEADDVIAHLCQHGWAKILHRDDLADSTFTVQKPILIVSGDHDLYSLVAEDVSMWKSRKRELYTINSFREEYSLEPWQYKEMLALMGCGSDNVPGVKGIGPKYAQKLISRYGTADAIKDADDDDTTATRVKAQWAALELSYKLVSFEDVRPVVIMQKPDLSKVRKRLFALCMNSLITGWSEIVHLSEL